MCIDAFQRLPLSTHNFCIFKYHIHLIWYAKMFTKLNLFKILFYDTFIATNISRSTYGNAINCGAILKLVYYEMKISYIRYKYFVAIADVILYVSFCVGG